MIRVLGTVLGHAKLLTCAGLVAGSCVAVPAAMHGYRRHHEGQPVAQREEGGRGERGGRGMQLPGHERVASAAYHGRRGEGRR
ncbi:MAG TPA: hypothetical protein VH253_18355 [Phycisphaerae bacterium]|nr:hypothetical protein [Phycisphaerae bacterium]